MLLPGLLFISLRVSISFPLLRLFYLVLHLILVTIFPYLIFSAYLISSYLGASLIFLPKISTSYDFSTRVRLARFARLTHAYQTSHIQDSDS